MPELPEVETVRRGLEPWLVGHTLEQVAILDPRLVQPASPAGVERDLRGRRVVAITRRGKYLLLELDDGLGAEWHLRMTGSFAAAAATALDTLPDAHVRARLVTEAGAHVLYRDPRRFGTLRVREWTELADSLDHKLGPEPLGPGFDAQVLAAVLARRTAPIKAALLDQRVVAGLGNIYVDEALLIARIHPETPAHRVSHQALTRLVDAIRERLQLAIEVGGSTLRDYRGVEGEVGGMQERFLAYGRAGEPCPVCGTQLRGMRVAGRGTTWCPRCQKTRR